MVKKMILKRNLGIWCGFFAWLGSATMVLHFLAPVRGDYITNFFAQLPFYPVFTFTIIFYGAAMFFNRKSDINKGVDN